LEVEPLLLLVGLLVLVGEPPPSVPQLASLRQYLSLCSSFAIYFEAIGLYLSVLFVKRLGFLRLFLQDLSSSSFSTTLW
jgi:hypothetical protein